jgi:hypothetical protein
MRLSLSFLCMSVVQSFVTKTSVVGSRPSTLSHHKIKDRLAQIRRNRFAPLSFLAPLQKRSVTSLNLAEILTRVENTTSTLESTGTSILADNEDFIKPDRDLHEYRHIKLPNNLQVLLVSTAKVSSSSDDENSARVEAASVHVQAGHFDDTIPGLAHFHEHMLVR